MEAVTITIEYDILRNNKDICIMIDRYMDARTEKFGLTSAQGSILIYVIKEKNGTDTSDLNKMFGISKSTVSSILKKLSMKGFITLEAHQDDNRRKTVFPTQKAMRVKNGLEREFELMQDELFHEFSEEDLNCLKKLQCIVLDEAKKGFDNYKETEEM